MNLSLYEQETIINSEECRLVKTSHDGKAVDYIIPKAWVKVKPPRIASETQKAALARARETANKHR